MNTDVIVVGGGPAGAILAYLLAKSGLEVTLIEKANLPRYKTCGGGLTNKAVQALPFDASSTFEKEAIGGVVSFAGQLLLKTEVQTPFAWLVMREQFDHFLVQKAVDAGVRLLEKTIVTGLDVQPGQVVVHTMTGHLNARIIAGADGVGSIIARSVGLLQYRDVGIALEAELEVPSNTLADQGDYATFDFGALPNGYGWIFPKKDHLSVGVFHASHEKINGLRLILERFIASHAILNNNRMIGIHGQQIPLGGEMTSLDKGRVLLLGDAANLADPWLGEGIYYAIRSAFLAAEVIVDVIDNATVDLSAYTVRVHQEIVRQLAYARSFAGMVYRLPRFGTNLLARSSIMQDIVFGAIRGDYSFQQMTKNLVWRMPNILVQALVAH